MTELLTLKVGLKVDEEKLNDININIFQSINKKLNTIAKLYISPHINPLG